MLFIKCLYLSRLFFSQKEQLPLKGQYTILPVTSKPTYAQISSVFFFNTLIFNTNECNNIYIYIYIYIYTVGTESIQTPLNFSLFVILQPFAKII